MELPPVDHGYYSFRERREELDKALVEVRRQYHKEYLVDLNQVRKIIRNGVRVEIGDIVYVTNHPIKGRDLPLGYVRSLRRGQDQEARNVEIVTRRGILWRMLDNFLLLERVLCLDTQLVLHELRF